MSPRTPFFAPPQQRSPRRGRSDKRRGILRRPALEILEDRVYPGDLLSVGHGLAALQAALVPQALVRLPTSSDAVPVQSQSLTAAAPAAPFGTQETAAAGRQPVVPAAARDAVFAGVAPDDPWADPFDLFGSSARRTRSTGPGTVGGAQPAQPASEGQAAGLPLVGATRSTGTETGMTGGQDDAGTLTNLVRQSNAGGAQAGGPGGSAPGGPGAVRPSAGTQRQPIIGGVAPEVEDPANPYSAGNLVRMAPGVAGPHPSSFSSNPVRYFDGTVELAFTDLQSGGFGTPWSLTRSWTNRPNVATNLNGNGVVVTQLPYLVQDTGGTLDEIANGYTTFYFDLVGGSYVERYYAQDHFAANSSAHEYVLTDTRGDQIRFNDFSVLPAPEEGTFKSYTDPDGNVTSVVSYDSTQGYPTEVQRSNTVGGTTLTESYLYTINPPSGDGDPYYQMGSVVLRRKVNSGAWTTVREADYTYYDGSIAHGNAGDLRTAVLKDGSGNVLDTTYYRYYTGESGGYVGGLKYLFRPDSYARLTAALGTGVDSLTDSQVAPYADNYFQYDTSRRVTQEVAAGAGSSSGSPAGLGTFTYSYTASGNTPGLNSWAMKTVETLPDGNTNTVYTNTAGQIMLLVYHDGTSGLNWPHFYEYDGTGHVILDAGPAAVTGYNDSYADLLHYQSGTGYQYLSSGSGLIKLSSYATTTTATWTTAGDAAGYLKNDQVQQGQSGTAVTTDGTQYFSHSDSGGNAIYPVANTTKYRNTDGSGGETTSYAYTWFTGTNQVQSQTTTLPVISSSQNGPGAADVTTTFNDSYGGPVWVKDGDGYLRYTAYDQATGAVVKTIADVNTADTGDFANLPSGWSTPTGGGLELITQYAVDGLGRTTQLTDPNGNVTYTVYLDTNYQVNTYPGWNSSTHTPTGPTLVTREDRPGSYAETLTMTATPHLTGGVPDGTEAISSIQTLSRDYTNAAGQKTSSDAYFNLSGVTYSTAAHLGTLNTNYYETTYAYDSRGRLSDTTDPTGTINHTDFDGLGRVIDTKVGTSSANLVTTTADVYDNNTLGGSTQVGDGNLTQQISYPGGSAANRVEQLYYDWRDRKVATKDGVQSSEDTTTHRPIVYTTYDNLDEVTEVQRYDGDGVTVTSTGGVPNAPSASLLRAQTILSFDDQGRVYKNQVYSVNPSTGTVSTYALTTNTYYNHRGEVIETAPPGAAVTKTAYDGVGRSTVVYTTDGAAGTAWSNAGSVTGDNVLSQVEKTYDSDGNVILTTDRERFHDETATGALGNATTSPKARVTYEADYYDADNRVTASVNVGTNGGSAYTRPSTVPSPSDTVLVTSTAYNAAGWVDTTTDPRGLVEKDYYDNLGRTTKTVAAYDGGSETATTNVTTEYTYDGSGHTLTVQADLTGGAYEQTKFVYGVTTSSSGLNSNDILAATQYPDPSTGNASSSQQESYTVDALGERLTFTDRDGNVHTYVYDVLARQTSDQVTTLGSGVDGSVRRIDTAYDTQGNAYLVTSYATTGTTTVVNQVQDAFNGLGQLITEYQAHGGAVNTSTTPKVQYTYAEMAGGANNSRLTSIIYPGTGTAAETVTYNYASGVDNAISRLTSLSDGTGTLESYKYLGLSTVVERDHPQTNVNLTYISQTGGTGDAGDKYVGLDRFGRVVDQNWYNTSTSTSTDRFQYTYDRDGNRLTQTNVVNTSFNESYTYDSLNQLATFARGSHTQSWTPDAAGNFSSVTTDGTGVSRTNNKQNEVTQVGSNTLTFDANGNTTTDDSGKTLVYDAWNRLEGYKSGGTTLETFQYDGLNRRIVTNPGTATDLYYSSDWQVLEEQVGGVSKDQYVWSPVYVDALVLRARDADGNSSNGLEERLYTQQDANYDVTALVNTSGTVVERDNYDPYGKVTFLTASWSTLSGSAYAWVYLRQGGRFEITTGLGYYRRRDYSPTLMRWMEVDPEGFGAGDINLYRDVSDDPTKYVDPNGLEEKVIQYQVDPNDNDKILVRLPAGNVQTVPLKGKQPEDYLKGVYKDYIDEDGYPVVKYTFKRIGPRYPSVPPMNIATNDPEVRNAFKKAWSAQVDSGNEQAGWIIWDKMKSEVYVVHLPEGLPTGVTTFDWPPDKRNPGDQLVGWFHTHPPRKKGDKAIGKPSDADKKVVAYYGRPGTVVFGPDPDDFTVFGGK